MRSRSGWLVLLALVALVTGACTDDDGPDPAPTPSTPVVQQKVDLTWGVYGEPAEVDDYERVAAAWNAESDSSTVTVKIWPSRDAFVADIRAGRKLPDLFLASRRDLQMLRADELTRPVGQLLDERNVDLGDDYSRDALEAFALDRELQCMPWAVQPGVIFYNTKLVNFERMEQRGLDVPNTETHAAWSLEQFQAAAEFATRPRRNTKGFYVEPSLFGLAPYVLSGGGRLFDSDDEPRSTAFSDEDTRSALEAVLPLLRDPLLTLSADQLARRTPLEWFQRGKLGMMAGTRSLVPELRSTPGLDFDVMPMPRVEDAATTGDFQGLCIARKAADVPETADFLAHVITPEQVSSVVRSGYIVPASQTVALGEDFLQPDRLPAHANVFTDSIGDMRFVPVQVDIAALAAAIGPGLRQLLTVNVIDDLVPLTEEIDRESLRVLDPERYAELEASEAASPSSSPEDDEE
ncbi:ABC transporter substrate-binding protein [Nocardioides sp. SYSU D00038]|uniref:ABC transporter substrate-binding protein n=1 Tax=Nocardioides sp. SYSU D00038 TaxID=2812554 RepID=UPI00196733C4|nr:extracellular solute-binding protein [Nocardioides sp. SYSU D00038]